VAVALNSSRNGLLALLIANNFVEIKSTVFKKWDSTRIWSLVCQVGGRAVRAEQGSVDPSRTNVGAGCGRGRRACALAASLQ
jgi:hypothetical protein